MTIMRVFTLLCLISFGASCQTQKDIAQENNHETIKRTPTPPTFHIDDGSKQLINDAGWKLPDLSLFSEQSREIYKETSKAKIVQTSFSPIMDVIQNADGNIPFNVERDPDIKDKSWAIQYLKVFSVNKQPFCYVMRGNWVEVDSTGKIKDRLAMSAVLVYSDQNGDGRFETFKYSSSEMPLIPERILMTKLR
ncbi:MAG: hypothetical protein KF756_05885 [Acidobacteria bacterium]|nr:hypothetical protein [Acidobacteriota bacterium]